MNSLVVALQELQQLHGTQTFSSRLDRTKLRGGLFLPNLPKLESTRRTVPELSHQGPESLMIQRIEQEHTSFKEIFLCWLPRDVNTFLFELIAVTYLIAAAIHFVRANDATMLTTILTWTGTHVGLVKVKHIIHGGRNLTKRK